MINKEKIQAFVNEELHEYPPASISELASEEDGFGKLKSIDVYFKTKSFRLLVNITVDNKITFYGYNVLKAEVKGVAANLKDIKYLLNFLM